MTESADDYVPLARLYDGAEDDARTAADRRDDLDRPRSARTRESWLIALMPAFALVVDAAFVAIVDGALLVLAVVAITVGASVLSTGLARADQQRLAELGHTSRTRPALAILPPLYLFVRGSRAYRETFEGLGVAWVSLVVVIVSVYTVFVAAPALLVLGSLLRQSTDYYSG